MTRKVVFLSYSHDSGEHREKVLAFSERLRADGFDTRLDQYINGTPDQTWPRWMLDQLDAADFVLVVCTETYYRRFRGHEVPEKGKGVDWEGALITQELYDARSRTQKFVPVMLSDGQQDFIPEPLRGVSYYTLISEDAYQALRDFLLDQAGVEPGKLGPVKKKTRRTATPLTFALSSDDGGRARRVAPSKLTHAAATLFGRDAELADLDTAWKDAKTHVVTLVAWGGVGKTSLVHRWTADLAARDHDGADYDYFDWSFYSQGTRETGGPSSDAFVAAALRFFGDAELAQSSASAWDKGARLAELVAERRTLLVLDGLEPLQHPPGPLAGQLKDPAVTALLKGLAARNPGLCVVTTRESVVDLVAYGGTAPEWKLGHLSTTAGVQLLGSLGVHGADAEVEQLVVDVQGHALTLNLLGRFLKRAHGGDVRRRDRVKLEKADLKIQGGHAFKAMAAYKAWLAEGGEDGARQVAVLRLLGLFDRPADAGCLEALRREPVLVGLTEPLVGLGEDDWNVTVSELADCDLVSPSSIEGSALDAHPLVREYFARQLRDHKSGAWQDAHGRLFEHLQASVEHQPDTLEGLQPLYQAVGHGCQAGRHKEARANVYRDRILRGQESYSTSKLGAFGADLGAVACFFDPPWSRVSPSLTENQAWLLGEAAFILRNLGRLNEAVEPMRAALQMGIEQEDWLNAAVHASNLSELELTLGDVDGAVRNAEHSVVFADRSGDAFNQLDHRSILADALHQAGRRADALARFRKTEEMQAERQPAYPLLYSLAGFRYCDLLLGDIERDAWSAWSVDVASALPQNLENVEQRAARTLEWTIPQNWILDIALDHLTLGRAGLYRTILERRDASESKSEIEEAVDGLRRASSLDHLPRGLLTRAWLRVLADDSAGSRADLDEAAEIAERGPMPLHLADVHLHRARLFRDRRALAEARRLIEKHGYGRRLEELADAEASSKDWD